MWCWYEGAGWWILFSWLGLFILCGGIIALVILLVRRNTERGGSEGRHSALDIAEQRYARGEISREEFKQIKEDLS